MQQKSRNENDTVGVMRAIENEENYRNDKQMTQAKARISREATANMGIHGPRIGW